MEPRELFGNDYMEFCIVDPFNPKNEVSGYISRKPNEYYGALLIEKVNNRKVRQQLVMGSPKMHYPFFARADGSRNYRFPTAQKIEIYDKLDGCFNYHTPILLADGTKRPIGKIVNQDEFPQVWSFDNDSQKVSVGKVTKLYKYKAVTPRVIVEYKKLRWHRGNTIICCTEDHPFLTEQGWKKAGELCGQDKIFRFSNKLPYMMREFIIGSLLGDASIWIPSKGKDGGSVGNPNVGFRHSEKQKGYLDIKYKLLKHWARQTPKRYDGGYNTYQWQFATCSDSAFVELYDLFINNKGVKRVPINIECMMTPATLSIWFLDDGSTQFSETQRERRQFHTEGFDIKEVRRLLKVLTNKFGLIGRVEDYGKGAIIEIDAESSCKLYSIIAPYVPKCMHYKIPESYRIDVSYWEQLHAFPKNNYSSTPVSVVSVKPFKSKGGTTDSYVYDLTVEDGHSYFAGEVLVHNTNVLAYNYFDKDEKYTTYKPRLRPFLQPGRYGDFLGMWKEVAHDYFKEIRQAMNRHQCNLSFELYGARNTHLIIYENSLDIALLFGVTNEGRIIPPSQLKFVNLPVVNKLKEVVRDYVYNYESLQQALEKTLKPEDEEHYSGSEGAVWYLHTMDNRCIQLKCKSDTIETIHFAMGAGLGKNPIIATCWNAFETTDTPTVDLIKQMLLEEFTQEKIDPQSELIERCLASVMEQAEFRAKVLDEYRATGLNILTDKAGVMRKLSGRFTKNEMKAVYSIIKGA